MLITRSVWAVRLNPTMVELKRLKGPAKVRVSQVTKQVRVQLLKDYNDQGQPVYKYTKEPMLFKQTHIVGGLSLAIISPQVAASKLGVKFEPDDDAFKLEPKYAKLALSAAWREANL